MDNFDYTDVYSDSGSDFTELSVPLTRQSADSDTEDDYAEPENLRKNKPRPCSKHPVLTAQLIACLGILLLLYLLKLFLFPVFDTVKSWYCTQLNASVIFDGDLSGVDYSGLFSATADEI